VGLKDSAVAHLGDAELVVTDQSYLGKLLAEELLSPIIGGFIDQDNFKGAMKGPREDGLKTILEEMPHAIVDNDHGEVEAHRG